MANSAILCVDDERLVLDSLKIQLKEEFGETYYYEMADSADDALEVIDELHEADIEVVVIVSDWLMPGMKGDEFLIHVHEKFPNIIKVMLTGEADNDTIELTQNQANLLKSLHKPWNGDELIEII